MPHLSVIPAKAGIHWFFNFWIILKSILAFVPQGHSDLLSAKALAKSYVGMTNVRKFFNTFNYIAIFFSFFLTSQLALAALVEIPELKTRVTDLTQTLSQAQQAQLEQKLAAFEAKKGSQIAVLIMPSTKPEEIEQYSTRLVQTWKFGRKKEQDGVLILVAKDDHKLRIEVDSGLQGAIPDLIAKRIISEIIAPKFKQGDFYGGLDSGIDKLFGLVDGEALPAPSSAASNGKAIENILPMLLFGGLISGLFLRSRFGTFFGSALNGGLLGGVVTLLGLTLGGAAIFAFVAFIVTMMMGGGMSGGIPGGGYGGGGWSGGGGSGGWSGGGSEGWSGGGASGDW
jgi:uncharacterized protein